MKNFNFYLISLIFILSFFKGLLALMGVVESIVQLLIDILIIVLFFKSILNVLKKKKIIAPGIIINICLFVVIMISFLFSHINTLLLVIFIRKFALYYLFFYALFNLKLTEVQIEKLKKLIIFLFIIQVPAAFIKVLILGGTLEKIVGTMSVAEGSLATTMPLIAASYLISNYLIYKKFKYIIWVLLFVVIGLVSNKMAILFYLIILFIYLSYFYATPKVGLPNLIFIKKLFINILYSIVIFILFVMLNPRANPEHKVGGSVDIEYVINFVEEHNTKKPSPDEGEGQGRFDAPFVVFDRLSNGGLFNVLFGFGPGDIVKSAFVRYDNPLLEKYNIGYGARQGYTWFGMQIGIIGVFFITWFQVILFRKILHIYKELSFSEEDKLFILTVLGFFLVFFLDIFSYSRIIMTSPGVVLTYYFGIFYVLYRAYYSKI